MTEEKNIDQSFIQEIRQLWSAEKMLTLSMPAMIEKATNFGLKKNLAHHLAETDQHKVALEAICKQLGFKADGEDNQDMKAILDEGENSINREKSGKELDAAIITSALKVEQYEISAYFAAASHAESLGYEGIAKRLYLTLEEERQADTKLNFLKKNFIDESSEIGIQEREIAEMIK